MKCNSCHNLMAPGDKTCFFCRGGGGGSWDMNSLADSKPASSQLWTRLGLGFGILFGAIISQSMPAKNTRGIDVSQAIAFGLVLGFCIACGWVIGKIVKLVRG